MIQGELKITQRLIWSAC